MECLRHIDVEVLVVVTGRQRQVERLSVVLGSRVSYFVVSATGSRMSSVHQCVNKKRSLLVKS